MDEPLQEQLAIRADLPEALTLEAVPLPHSMHDTQHLAAVLGQALREVAPVDASVAAALA